jgi:hypothetical protein
MRKKIWMFGILIIFGISFLSGCQQEGTITEDTLNNILLDSDIVELVYSSINYKKNDDGIITSAEVQYQFRNIADRNIKINVFAEFYDEDDNFITREGPKEISIPKGWTEQGLSPANIIKYSGEKSSNIDYVKIIVEEIV